VHGSPGLVQTLLENELVDELNLLQSPVVLGGGKRFFGSGAASTAFQLLTSRTTSKGVLIGTYRPAGRPVYGSAALDVTS
jgi:dihydrofolate reductase